MGYDYYTDWGRDKDIDAAQLAAEDEAYLAEGPLPEEPDSDDDIEGAMGEVRGRGRRPAWEGGVSALAVDVAARTAAVIEAHRAAVARARARADRDAAGLSYLNELARCEDARRAVLRGDEAGAREVLREMERAG